MHGDFSPSRKRTSSAGTLTTSATAARGFKQGCLRAAHWYATRIPHRGRSRLSSGFTRTPSQARDSGRAQTVPGPWPSPPFPCGHAEVCHSVRICAELSRLRVCVKTPPPNPLPATERGSKTNTPLLLPLSVAGRGLGGGVFAQTLTRLRSVKRARRACRAFFPQEGPLAPTFRPRLEVRQGAAPDRRCGGGESLRQRQRVEGESLGAERGSVRMSSSTVSAAAVG